MCGKCSIRIFILITCICFSLNPAISQDTVKVAPPESNKKTTELSRFIRNLAKQQANEHSSDNSTSSKPKTNVKSDTAQVLQSTSEKKKSRDENSQNLISIDTLLNTVFEDSNQTKNNTRVDWRVEREGRLPLIKINRDDKYTISTNVTLSIVAPGASEIKVSNKDDFKGSQWGPVCSEMDWLLPDREGYQRVYLKLLYPDSSQSQIYYDEIISDLTPPVAKFNVSPDSGIAGETIFTFNATESHHNFEIYLRWDWDNDGVFDTDWSVSKNEVFVYDDGGGAKTVRLQIKTEGGWLVDATRELAVYARPMGKLVYRQNFDNPLIIDFDATASNDFEDGKNTEVRWDFDNDHQWDTQWSWKKIENRTLEEFLLQTVVLSIRDRMGLISTIKKVIRNRFHNMVFVKAGPYKMGCAEYEVDEAPVHLVHVDDFWIDKFPVTNQQFAEFLNEAKLPNPETRINLRSPDVKIFMEDSIFVVESGFENHPVIEVNWHGAKDYAEFYGKSLPTEAEWEKVARGSDQRMYPWGNEITGITANYWDSGDPFDNSTTPVGFFNGQMIDSVQTTNSASPYGVYDLVDNVREWCLDWYQRDYYAQSPYKNPKGAQSGAQKVVRGGGYLFYPDNMRTTFRASYEPTTSNNYIGFRCVIRRKNLE